MSKKTSLEEVRTILLSLLLARKGATPVPVLERDFYEEEHMRIPYRQFGYINTVEFLRSMPEHFIVEQHNGNHYVHGIASEKTRHVSEMVARQKVNLKNVRYVPSHLRQSVNRPHIRPQQIKVAPESLYLLMQHIRMNPHGVSLQNAVIFVQKLVPFVSISIQELRSQLQLLSHQLILDGNMIYPSLSNDLQNVAQQQSSMEEPQPQNELLNNLKSPPTKHTICAAGEEDLEDGIQYFSDDDFVPAGYTGNHRRHTETSKQYATNYAQYTNCEQTDMFNYNKNNDAEINGDFAMMNDTSNLEMKTREYHLSEIVNDRTKVRLEELMRKYPEGIWCADLPNVYLQEYKVRLNYNQLGFVSVREFTSYLPEIFYMTQVNKTDDFMLYSADKRPVVPKTDPIDIAQASHSRYDEHNSMQAQCSHDDDDNNEPIPSEVSPTITKNFAPSNVMNYNDNVEKILVTELKQGKKTYLEVYVIEVFNPSFFWIHLRENKKRFGKMMDDITNFYQSNRDMYTIAKIALKKNMHCACVYMGRWHRGIIKCVKPDFRVTVFFYDYGTLKTYPPEDIYYLHKRFSYLPAQAIPCGLYNVKPCVGDRWKRSVINQFIDRIAETLLAATIMSIDPTDNSMMVILTDTSDEDDVHINDWLVKERLAQVGNTADAVNMASIMKYVVNNFNELPTYCFAEENLMPDNCCKATLTEEKYEVPLVSPGSTLLHDHHQQQPMRPPPGFPPLGEQYIPSNLSTTNFYNSYSFANTSNTKTSAFNDAEALTNPFLSDQEFVSNDVTKQMCTSVRNENKKLQIKVIDILCDLLEHSSLELNDQIQLNKILKIVEKILLEQKDDRPTVVKTPSTPNPASGMTVNDVSSAQKTPYNISNETFSKQDFNANIFSKSNPFGVNGDDRSQSNATFPSYDTGFSFKANWNQSDKFNSRIQMPPSATVNNPAPSPFINHVPPANTFLPNTNQNRENIPATSASSTAPTNTNIFNNFSEYLEKMNTQFTNILKNTNPFKFPMTEEIQVPKTQNAQTSHTYDTGIASYLSAKNPQNHTLKTETANIHASSNYFMPAGHVSENNYAPNMVYESGPVMYNMQKKQADIDARQNTCSINIDNIQSTQSLELGQDKKLTSQPVNDITTSQHKMINQMMKDSLQIDEKYIRPSTCYAQGSQPIINGESIYYQQNSNASNMQSQPWNKIEIPEHSKYQRTNLKYQNSVPLSNHSENAAFDTPITLPHQDWNCDNSRKSKPQEINEATDSNYVFKFKADHNKERPIDICTNSWNNTDNGSVQKKDAISINSFVFQKIDSVKGVTFLFDIEQDGWILTYEFVEAFTNLKLLSRLLAILEAMKIKVIFKEIHRSEFPIQFSQLDRYPLKVPRDSEKRIISLNLISLQNALTLLHKLQIVPREEIDNAFKKNEFLDGSILPTMWILIVTYRDLKRRIEIYSNYITV